MKQIITTYAWKEETSDPDCEYRNRRRLYERGMRDFNESLRDKYGSENVKSLEDYSRMPVRVSQVSYSDKIIRLHVFAQGGGYPISNTKRNVGTSDALFHWILHLCRKPWITGQILFDFIELVSKLYGIDVPWDFDLEHQSFPEDCETREEARRKREERNVRGTVCRVLTAILLAGGVFSASCAEPVCTRTAESTVVESVLTQKPQVVPNLFAAARRNTACRKTTFGTGLLNSAEANTESATQDHTASNRGRIQFRHHHPSVPRPITVVEVNSASGPKARADADTSTTPIASFALKPRSSSPHSALRTSHFALAPSFPEDCEGKGGAK